MREADREDIVQQVFDTLLNEQDVRKYVLEGRKVLPDIFVNNYNTFEKARGLMLDTLEKIQENA